MNKEKMFWTVLPNGLEEDHGVQYLKLTVFASPRLYSAGDTTLGHFPELLNWPKTLDHAAFTLTFRSPSKTVTRTAQPDPHGLGTASETIWGHLFDKNTFVRGYKFQDYQQRFVMTNPYGFVANYLKTTYQTVVAANANQLPGYRHLLETVAQKDFGNGFPNEKALIGLLHTWRSSEYGKQHKTLPAPASAHDGLTQLQLFYRRGWKKVNPWPSDPQQLDFHEQVSSLTKFAELLRHTGLAIDLRVKLDHNIPTGPGTTVWLKSPVIGSSPITDINPRTAYMLTASHFAAASSSGKVKEGMLDLSSAKMFDLIQMDVDGAGLKMVGLVKLLFNMDVRPGSHAPEPLGLPSLRSGGLAIAQIGRGEDLTAIFPEAAGNNAKAESGNGNTITLHAEDLIRGFRIDVWDSKTTEWHSLHLRQPAMDPANPPAPFPHAYLFGNPTDNATFFDPMRPDEGFVSMGVTQDPNNPPNADLYLHEVMWRWMGWSLSGGRPNRYMGLDDTPSEDDDVNNEPGPGVKLSTRFGPLNGSLPRLRFGRQYRMRARVVDLAANSVPVSSPTDDFELPAKGAPALTYRRFEPVITPAVVIHDDLSNSPGESHYRMVIRSNLGKTADQELSFLMGLGYGKLPPSTQRHIASPQMSQLMAEHHGLFDSGFGQSHAYELMTTRDGDFGETAHPENKLKLPYLPDIFSRGASFRGLPGVAPAGVYGPVGTLPNHESLRFTGSWPDLDPFRLEVKEHDGGTGAPEWNATQRVLTVFLNKAEMTTVELSSFMFLPDIKLMGVFAWLVEMRAAGKLTAHQFTLITEYALAGVMWALTPFQEITMLNATQQPLVVPKFEALLARKTELGATDALLLDKPMAINGPSTTKVDISAAWQDPRDDLTLDLCPQTMPTLIPHQQHVVEIPVTPPQQLIDFDSKANLRHKFGDTKHRFVDYTATATTRFLEYFPDDPKIPTTWDSPVAKHVNVLSSARPSAPDPLYVIPAFEWSGQKPVSGGVANARTGGWLRVYLNRTWFSSGEGELLGVVLIDNAKQIDVQPQLGSRVRRAAAGTGLVRNDNSGVAPALEKYVTNWGNDPLWSTPGIQNPPMLANFPAASARASNLYLDELGGLKGGVPVSVAGFPVNWDHDRCLWFSDIHFDWGQAYYPFVRLALSRFQPNSMALPDTMHLSRVVMTDFVQLAPNRVAEVLRTNGNPQVKVAVAGFMPQGGTAGPGPAGGTRIDVTLEQQAPGIPEIGDGEIAWVPVPNANYVLTPNTPKNSNVTVWSGIFDLPHPAGSVPYRVLIKEHELYPTGWGQYIPPVKGQSQKDAVVQKQYDLRLVYACTLQI